MRAEHPWIDELHSASLALQSVLGAVLEAERRFEPPTPPLQRLHEITTSPEWEWLQPLYRLIADIDHALASADDLPASEAAAIGAHARELISGTAVPQQVAPTTTGQSVSPEQSASRQPAFIARYRALLQADPGVAIAHAGAMKALRVLPAESADEVEKQHTRQLWNHRSRYLRTRQDGQRAS